LQTRFIGPVPFRQELEKILSDLAADVGKIIHHMLREPSLLPGFRDQFRPQERGATTAARNINAAFLISLTGKRLSHPARGYLSSMSESVDWGSTAAFYLQALERIEEELAGPGLEETAETARELVRYLETSPEMTAAQTLERFWNFFFPEGEGLFMRHDKGVLAAEATEEDHIEKLVRNCEQIMTSASSSLIPVTASCLRMALTVAGMFTPGSEVGSQDGEELVGVATARLGEAMNNLGKQEMT
jgi:hypothetical protein